VFGKKLNLMALPLPLPARASVSKLMKIVILQIRPLLFNLQFNFPKLGLGKEEGFETLSRGEGFGVGL